MEEYNGELKKIVLQIQSTDDGSVIIRALYKELKLDEYIPYANLDGLNDLIGPDLFPEMAGMHINIQGWDEWKADHEEYATRLEGVFKELQQNWRQVGKSVEFNYQ